MARYLLNVSYSPEGVRGIMKEGGTSRRAFIEDLINKQGGTLEAFYFAFGKDDVIVIAEMPDNKTMAALSMTASGSGAVSIRTTVLLTPDEIDDATQISVAYRPPGG